MEDGLLQIDLLLTKICPKLFHRIVSYQLHISGFPSLLNMFMSLMEGIGRTDRRTHRQTDLKFNAAF